MSISNGYSTAAAFKVLIGGTETAHDADIDRAVEAASRSVDRYTRRRFFQDASVVTRVYTTDDPRWCWCNDISTSTGLVVKTDDNWDGTYENTWTLDDYTGSYGFALEPPNASDDSRPWTSLAPLSGSFPTLRYAVQVTAKFGWPAVPLEVAQATLLLAHRIYRRKESPFGLAQAPEMGEAVFIRKHDPDVALLLENFVKVVGP